MERIIENVINNFINNIEKINEGFSAMKNSSEIDKIVKTLLLKYKRGNSNKVSIQTNIDGLPIYITLKFTNNEGIQGGFYNGTINIIAQYGTSVNLIKQTLEHEITHLLDKNIQSNTSYKAYKHQYNNFPENLNENIAEILYSLWDTSEFNAWQTSRFDPQKVTDAFVERLKELEVDNDIETWQVLKDYFIDVFGKDKWTNKPLTSVKKYFLKISYDRIKKFSEKLNRIKRKGI